MRNGRVWLGLGGVSCLLVALAAAAIVAAGQGPVGRSGAPLAVVLVPHLAGSELVSVDADTGKVVGRVRLRSLATDIDVDESRGTVVAAQTGGLGDDADDALSVTDPRSGRVTYLRLPQVDPSQVECVAGRAMVLHAVIEQQGFAVSAVDLASGTTALRGHVPDGPGLWASVSGALWTSVACLGPARSTLLRVDPATLATAPGPPIGFAPNGLVETSGGCAVFGGGEDQAAGIAVLDRSLASVTARFQVPGLPHGAHIAAAVGGTLVVGDWSGESPESAALQVLDMSTLRLIRTLRPGGVPCAVSGYAGSLLVVDRLSGTLVRVDPLTGRVIWRAALGARDLLCSQVVVVHGTGSSASGG
jgi:hypothetical protein